MFRERKNCIYLILSANLMIALCCTGCRSGMSRTNMFGFRSEPSAEALAGNGPTTTYPAPPGDSLTPQAIASIAAGTAASSNDPITSPVRASNSTAQVSGIDIDPGYVVPASSNMPRADKPVTNMAAAQANGIFHEKIPEYASNVSKTTAPSGYQYGSKSSMPASAMPASAVSMTPSTAMVPPASDTPPMSAYTAPSTSTSDQSGFTMPEIGPGVAAEIDSVAAQAKTMIPSTAPAPEYRISSIDDEATIPTIDTGAPASAPSTSAGGYTPGSTAGAVGYPVGGFAKPDTTGGSFYR